MKRSLLSFILCGAILPAAFSFSPDSELVPTGHWLYGALERIYADAGEASLGVCAPASRFELRSYLDSIDIDSLCEQGRALYRKASEYLGEREPITEIGFAAFDSRPVVSFSARYRASQDAFFDFDLNDAFKETKPLVSLPLELCFTPNVTGYADLSAGEGVWASKLQDNFTNIPNNASYVDINMPKTAYLSVGNEFCTAVIGRGALGIGRTFSGSMILSDSADRLDYASLSLFSPGVRFSMMPVELAPDRFAYYHTLSFRPLKFLSITFSEASLVNSTLDLRYLNPFMIFHSYAGWRDSAAYGKGDETTSSVGSQLGLEMSLVPFRGMTVYGQVVMNQFQTQYERENFGAEAAKIPDSLGGTLGVKLSIPFASGFITGTLEGVYANPWMYILDNKAISWYWSRFELVAPSSYTDKAVSGWLGSPYGPDTIAGVLNVRYEDPESFSLGLTYRFICKGINSEAFMAFQEGTTGTSADYYYPQNLAQSSATTPYGAARFQNLLLLEASWRAFEGFEVSGFAGYALMTGAVYAQSPIFGCAVTWYVR